MAEIEKRKQQQLCKRKCTGMCMYARQTLNKYTDMLAQLRPACLRPQWSPLIIVAVNQIGSKIQPNWLPTNKKSVNFQIKKLNK